MRFATKKCRSCGKCFPATDEFFYTTKVNKRGGVTYRCLRPLCKPCNVKDVKSRKHALGNANEKIRKALGGNNCYREWMRSELGYCAGELAKHLEEQFTAGMDWEMFFRGEIHLDHIVPVCDFDRSSKSDMVMCYALSNMRPSWARDNLAKSGKRQFLL